MLEICQRARVGLDIWEEVRDIVDTVLAALGEDLAPFLTSDATWEESFVYSAKEMNQANTEMAMLIREELRLEDQIETIEIGLTMLQRLAYSERELIQKVQESLSQFLQPTVQISFGAAEITAGSSTSVLERWISELETPFSMLDSLEKEIESMISTARLVAARAHFQRTIQEIPQDDLADKWNQLLSGDISVSNITKESKWSNEQIQSFRNFILTTSLRLECEVADLEKQELLEIAAEMDDVGGVAAEETPFCLKVGYPDPVGLWEEFEVRLWVRNDDVESQVLDNIQVEGALLFGFEVVKISPPPSHGDVDSDDGALKLEYGTAIASGDSLEVILVLRAHRQGNFSGEISIWNRNLDVSTTIPNIDVVHRQ